MNTENKYTNSAEYLFNCLVADVDDKYNFFDSMNFASMNFASKKESLGACCLKLRSVTDSALRKVIEDLYHTGNVSSFRMSKSCKDEMDHMENVKYILSLVDFCMENSEFMNAVNQAAYEYIIDIEWEFYAN